MTTRAKAGMMPLGCILHAYSPRVAPTGSAWCVLGGATPTCKGCVCARPLRDAAAPGCKYDQRGICDTVHVLCMMGKHSLGTCLGSPQCQHVLRQPLQGEAGDIEQQHGVCDALLLIFHKPPGRSARAQGVKPGGTSMRETLLLASLIACLLACLPVSFLFVCLYVYLYVSFFVCLFCFVCCC